MQLILSKSIILDFATVLYFLPELDPVMPMVLTEEIVLGGLYWRVKYLDFSFLSCLILFSIRYGGNGGTTSSRNYLINLAKQKLNYLLKETRC